MPAVLLCSQIVIDAIELRASDIHIEPGPQEMRVRLRIDGVLREHLRLPHWMCAALVSRIKILAKLDIATQRIPQDGRIKARRRERRLDMRVSTLPTQFRRKGRPPAARIGEHAEPERARPLHRRDGAARRRAEPAAGADPRDRADGRRQEHDALLDAHEPPIHRRQHRHHRGPDRVPGAGRQPGAGGRQGRPDLRAAASAPSCGRIRTSSSSARSAISRPPRSRFRRRSPVTWSSARCTPTARWRRSSGSSISASSRCSSRPRRT